MQKQIGFHKTIKGTCKGLSFEGKGVVKTATDTIFVEGIFPGEEGEITIAYKRNGVLFGEVTKLTKLSPDRIDPLCKIHRSCGGCCFQQYAYNAQLIFKKNQVKEAFRKITKMEVEVLDTIGMENPYFYRNKIQMPFGKDNKGNIYCGFYKQRSHVIVPVDNCYIEDEMSSPILKTIKELLKSFKIDPYKEDERSGVIRHVLIKTSKLEKKAMVVLVTNVDSFKNRGEFVKALTRKRPEISTVVQNINTRSTNVILGEKERILFGKGYINEELCGLKFRISAKSFFQVNPTMAEVLYQKAIDAGHISKEDIVFDAYSGTGSIGLVAAKKAKEVISVEIVRSAVKDGLENAKESGIDNFRMYCDDASNFIQRMANDQQHIDVLFMDPPRKGSDTKFLDALLKIKPNRIVYVSCEPITLARDIAYLSKSYSINSIQPVDMFPHSPHIECVVALENSEAHV